MNVKTACGGTLNDSSGYPSAMFQGDIVYFCSKACLDAFRKSPVAFMAGEIEHPIEDAKNHISNEQENLK